MIRGVVAGLLGASVMTAAAVVVPAIANGAETDTRWTQPLPAAQQRAAMHWQLPKVAYLKHVHKVRHHEARASWTAYRAPLTGDPRAIARVMVLRRGWSEGEFSCLDTLWSRESGWQTYATN